MQTQEHCWLWDFCRDKNDQVPMKDILQFAYKYLWQYPLTSHKSHKNSTNVDETLLQSGCLCDIITMYLYIFINRTIRKSPVVYEL